MKVKIAKRSAEEYESSLSSRGSHHDNIISDFQKSLFNPSSHGKCNAIQPGCRTPKKNFQIPDKSYSVKKACSKYFHKQDEESVNEDGGRKWQFQSQDSKIRKNQNNCCQLQNQKFKEHIKALKFEEDKQCQDFDKQNQPIRVNRQQFSSESENEQIQQVKRRSKRMVGRVLYLQKQHNPHFQGCLSSILEEESSRFV